MHNITNIMSVFLKIHFLATQTKHINIIITSRSFIHKINI